jgi:hypothetical protein
METQTSILIGCIVFVGIVFFLIKVRDYCELRQLKDLEVMREASGKRHDERTLEELVSLTVFYEDAVPEELRSQWDYSLLSSYVFNIGGSLYEPDLPYKVTFQDKWSYVISLPYPRYVAKDLDISLKRSRSSEGFLKDYPDMVSYFEGQHETHPLWIKWKGEREQIREK